MNQKKKVTFFVFFFFFQDYLDKVTKMDIANDVMSGQWPKEEIIARAKAPLLLIDESIQQNVSQQDDLLEQIQTKFSDVRKKKHSFLLFFFFLKIRIKK